MRNLPFCCRGKEDVSLRVTTVRGMYADPLQQKWEREESKKTWKSVRGCTLSRLHTGFHRVHISIFAAPHTASWGEGISLTDNSFTGRDLQSYSCTQFKRSWVASHSAQVKTLHLGALRSALNDPACSQPLGL